MQEIKIFLLDFNPSSGLGCELREILEINVTPPIYLKEEAPEGSGFDAFFPELSTMISNFEPSLVLLVLPPGYLNHTRKLIQSLSGSPLIAVLEGFKSEEMLELLRLGVSDFIIPPLKGVDILPRVRRLLEQKGGRDTLIHFLKEKTGLK
jgi:two-component system response regulator GlrR